MNEVLSTPEATFEWGRRLADSLNSGSVVALCGHLGAGKTQAVKGIVEGLGSRADVTSPTFTLVHEYLDGRAPIYHFDFYRMEREDEVLSLGWDDYMDDAAGIVLVEWADLFPRLMPAGTRWFTFEALPDGARRVMEKAAPAA
ncbi:MAG TPA: tRNA (adenosine(37)-N6)-threonylcarbamoyltransferase complex ATPase subunit type 1 TsaE [Prosthecobacter sp.]|nr:tRNA (adenosine(37)-N6)-threonylcarbamoyltransferase complex ATPase subunit type 1 TsaE [Prosthecobacter sp.]